jgi:inorganic pyrophosphatase
MTDFDQLFDAGVAGEYINTIVEIPKNSMNKIEYDRDKKVFILDRVEPGIFAKPVNYGFIPQTTDEDGDALDTLIMTDEPLPTGVVVKAKVVAVLNFVDDGENDHKIICVPTDDRHWGSPVNDLSDLADAWKQQIEHHFNHYKDLKKPGSTKVEGWGDATAAWKVIAACQASYKS